METKKEFIKELTELSKKYNYWLKSHGDIFITKLHWNELQEYKVQYRSAWDEFRINGVKTKKRKS